MNPLCVTLSACSHKLLPPHKQTLRKPQERHVCDQTVTELKEVTREETGASPTRHPGAVDHLGPLLLVGGDFNVITVGALVTVPQQQPDEEEQAGSEGSVNVFHHSTDTGPGLTESDGV